MPPQRTRTMLPSMDLDLLVPLAGLALVDSTSVGTLLIPLWLMLVPGPLRVRRMLLFLATVAGYYLLLGLALLAGATWLSDALAGFLTTPAATWLQLALGVALFAGSFVIGPNRPREARIPVGDAPGTGEAPAAVAGSPSSEARAPGESGSGEPDSPAAGRTPRVARWRARAMSDTGSVGALMALAVGAAVIETATMVPYLSAIALITREGLPAVTAAGLLAGYCLVMILPALVLLVLRWAAARLVERPLRRLEGWLSRNAAETTAWIVGIVGFLLAADALSRSGLLERL